MASAGSIPEADEEDFSNRFAPFKALQKKKHKETKRHKRKGEKGGKTRLRYGYVRRFVFVLSLLMMLSSICMLPSLVYAINGDIVLSSDASLRYNPPGYDDVHFEGMTRETVKLSMNFTVPLSDIPFTDTVSLLVTTTEGHAKIIGTVTVKDPLDRTEMSGDIVLSTSTATWSHEYTVDQEGTWKVDFIGTIEAIASVGGVVVPVDKFGLLAPYIGLASTILVATTATAIYVKRVKRRKEKQ